MHGAPAGVRKAEAWLAPQRLAVSSSIHAAQSRPQMRSSCRHSLGGVLHAWLLRARRNLELVQHAPGQLLGARLLGRPLVVGLEGGGGAEAGRQACWFGAALAPCLHTAAMPRMYTGTGLGSRSQRGTPEYNPPCWRPAQAARPASNPQPQHRLARPAYSHIYKPTLMASSVGFIASGDADSCTAGVSQAGTSYRSSCCADQSTRRYRRPSLQTVCRTLIEEWAGACRTCAGKLAALARTQ